MNGRLTLALAALNGLLVLAVVAGIRSTEATLPEQAMNPVPAQAGSTAVPPKALNRFALPSLPQYEAILARPIFDESRRPQAVLAGAEPQVDSPFSLRGVVVTPEVREVWLARKGSPDILKLAIGQSIDGWEIDAIEQERVRLRKGSQAMVLMLERPLSGQPAPPRSQRSDVMPARR